MFKRSFILTLIAFWSLLDVSAATAVREFEDLDEVVGLTNVNAVVSGMWAIASDELAMDKPALSLVGGDLTIAPATRFITDDLESLRRQGGALLWRVIGGKVTGKPELDPPSLLEQWRISVEEDGSIGRVVPRMDDDSYLSAIGKWFTELGGQFHQCFVVNNRWQYITNGLLITLEIALCAVILGAIIGFLVAIIRSTHDKSGRFPILNAIMKTYLTVIRGTPMAVQLLIAYFVIFASCNNKELVAVLAFGLNSGAYVAEIMRAGISSIDPGQMEAGRSLGLSYSRTMFRIVLPQAVRNVLPALGNEFIVLLKDTSIASFIALQDLAKGGEIIRSQTYNVYMPFLMVALVYLIMVMFFTWILGKLERHLRNTGADVVHNDS